MENLLKSWGFEYLIETFIGKHFCLKITIFVYLLSAIMIENDIDEEVLLT